MVYLPKMKDLKRYFCSSCGHYCILMNDYLESKPTRKIDDSKIVNETLTFILFNTKQTTVYIKRENGYELQKRLLCPGCLLPICYHQDSKYVYFISDSLTLDVDL